MWYLAHSKCLKGVIIIIIILFTAIIMIQQVVAWRGYREIDSRLLCSQ